MRGKNMEGVRTVVSSAVILVLSMCAVVPSAWGEPSGASDLPTGLDPIQTALKEAFGANVSENIEEHSPTGAETQHVVAVADFRNTSGDPGLDPLQRSISEAIVTQLGKCGKIELVERTYFATVLEEMKFNMSDIIAPETAVQIGKSIGATGVILGSFTSVDGQIRINARVVEVSTGRITTTEDVQGEKSRALDLANALSERICSRLTGRPLPQRKAFHKPWWSWTSQQKSPKKAFLFSAIVPGAGEIYGGKLFKGAVFIAVEAALWTGYVLLNKKGEDTEDKFEAFADNHWNADVYLVWKERYISATGDTMRFTHALPRDEDGSARKTQQYYEMIGKYDQFASGWDDYPEDVPVDSVGYSELRLDYMDQREDSNLYLKRAGYIAGAIFFNHIVSAIDAAKQVSGSREEARSERRVKVRMAVWEEKGEPILALVVSKRF